MTFKHSHKRVKLPQMTQNTNLLIYLLIDRDVNEGREERPRSRPDAMRPRPK